MTSIVKTDRRVARSKMALRNALLTLMTKKPFSAIFITEIADLANCNRGTFYMHYENKEGLLEDLMNEVIADLIKSYRAPYQNVDSLQLDELPANAIVIFDHIYQNSSLYASLLHSEVLPEFREKMFHALTQTALEDFDFEESELSINQELRIIYTVHALLGIAFHWIQGGFKYSPEYMEEQLLLIINSKPKVIIKNRKIPRVK
ncbi:MAG: TetR/AcrR family transcriptional regulator C-terminal domain-containing protein [Paenibacillaceae bacterium]